MSTYNTEGQVHWYDSKTGDGMVKVKDKLIYFYKSKADFVSGDKVLLEVNEDFTQAENVKRIN